MGAWGFVSLAYGIVWGAIVVYWIFLKRRYRDAEMELNRLNAAQTAGSNAKN
jgi:CcmD family protein